MFRLPPAQVSVGFGESDGFVATCVVVLTSTEGNIPGVSAYSAAAPVSGGLSSKAQRLMSSLGASGSTSTDPGRKFLHFERFVNGVPLTETVKELQFIQCDYSHRNSCFICLLTLLVSSVL